MSKIKALDFAKYVENSRQRLSNALDSFDINKLGNSLDNLVSSAISNLKVPEIDTTIGAYDNTPDQELLWLKEYYDNDQLLEKNGGTYANCMYILHSKKALEDNSYKQIYMSPNCVNYVNDTIIEYSSVMGYSYKNEDFITVNGIEYILSRHYLESPSISKDEWANLYSKGYNEVPRNTLTTSSSNFRSIAYMFVDGLFLDIKGNVTNNALYFRQVYLSKNTAILQNSDENPFDTFGNECRYLNLIFSEINELHIIAVNKGTSSVSVFGIYHTIPMTIPTNIFLYGIDSLTNANYVCSITNFNKDFAIYNINTKNTKTVFVYVSGWLGVSVPKITYKGVFAGTLSTYENCKTVIIDNYDNVRNTDYFLLSSNNQHLEELSIKSVVNENISKPVNLDYTRNLKYLYLPKNFRSTSLITINCPRLSIDNWILLLNNFYDASSESAIKLKINTFIKHLFDTNYVKLNTDTYVKVDSSTEGAITISEAFSNKNWTISV